MKSLPVVDSTGPYGGNVVSDFFYIGPSLDFMMKNGKPFVIVFFDIYNSFHKMKNNTPIKILRHRPLHIYHGDI